MKNKVKTYLGLISIPISLLVAYLILIIIWNLFNLPSGENMVLLIKDYFTKYGLITVFIGALIEGFFLVGQYFPGGFIIFLGVIAAGRDYFRATQVVLVVMIAFFIAYNLNYLVGRYGWHRLFLRFGLKRSLDNAKKGLARRGFSSILLNYWEPNLSSIVATAAGTLKLSWKKFAIYSLIGILIWETFWGVLVFSLGSFALELMGPKYVLIIGIVWIGAIFANEFLRKKKSK
ncbi:VTT domain-containing protein [Candidatus Pacearchaeota archaeon]|nr:VTT domain-containing protein [Candidatus Pacearchaeota archaeon]